ncbi:hypothetical protein SAMN05216196_10956 [Lutimaribacter pacificus]|uniref:Anti-sigma factor NepR domain-containing protein n=1 Tax=Lutimaribacter pacificus TaxID=391948 RepID=A0A1H0M619_9RHOB|nr:NepR family anti-sigma factor [Lutimaribacter pacificus]SDO75570.1 hypothetical protein SAMN05216196_10956 [Lutimaribacter pacificus]SHK77909.1 hypothetical protein SAMN05444142_10956 [Lutimaribacter pacificus]
MAGEGSNRRPGTTGKSRQMIEENLRKVYQEMVDQEVPDKFRDLLAQLRKADEEGDASK